MTGALFLCPNLRMRNEEEKEKALSQDVNKAKPNVGGVSFQGKTEEKMGVKELKDFKPSIGECVYLRTM